MSRRLKFSVILLSVVLLAVLATSIGLSAALWADVGGEGTYAPQADTTDWNAWTKYFEYEEITDSTGVVGYAVISYTGINLPDVIFPQTYNAKPVTEIRNTVFADNTLKQLPVTIKIPASIVSIDASAFSNLVNLQSVVFAAYDSSVTAANRRTTYVDASGFSGCISLSRIEINREVNFGDYSFLGCMALTNSGMIMGSEGVTNYSASSKTGSGLTN